MNEPKARTSKLNLLAFGILIFVVVFATLVIVQAAGLEGYAGFFAGMVAAVAGMAGSLVFLRRPEHS
jgi:hypothetical protein